VAETRLAEQPLARRLSALSARRIGWLDNSKANAGLLLNRIAGELAGRGIEFCRVGASKNATAAAPESVMAHLRTCDAVVLAIAD
jgi:hypothetical protein